MKKPQKKLKKSWAEATQELIVMNSELNTFENQQACGDISYRCAQLPKPTAIYKAMVIQNPTSLNTYILDNYWKRPRITPSLPT